MSRRGAGLFVVELGNIWGSFFSSKAACGHMVQAYYKCSVTPFRHAPPHGLPKEKHRMEEAAAFIPEHLLNFSDWTDATRLATAMQNPVVPFLASTCNIP
jgi:hypothetical protein